MKSRYSFISAAPVRRGKAALSLAAAVASVVAAHGANIWDGGGTTDLWSDLLNWDDDAFPGYGTLTFQGATRTTNIVDANISMNQLLWTGTSLWTLNNSGGAVISLFDNGGTQAKIENQSTGLVTINAPITFAATTGSNWGEINAVGSGLTFGTGTLTVSGSGVNGIRMFGPGTTTIFNNTVSAAGKYFATTANAAKTVEIGGSFTSGDFYLMNGSTLKLNSTGTFTTSGLRLGGDFTTTGTQNLALGATFQLTSLTGGQTFGSNINSVTGNTSNALRVESLNTSGTNTLSGSIFLDSPLRFNQAAGGTLAITGVVSNGSSLTAAGGGTIALSNTNTHSGGTTIGAAGDATVVQATANGALGTGTITLDLTGNQSASRLELSNGITLSNAVAFTGRNNASSAVVNVSGNNTMSGTFTINTGGSFYPLQSDAGLLTLSNATAITSAATGVRNVTLLGAGNGSITGIIQNGSGTVGLIKEGSGAWSLSGVNTYTGGVVLNAGTLNVNNAAALGNTTGGALTINGGTIDNTSGGAVVTTTAKAQIWNGDFTFTGTNNLSFNGGAVTLGGLGASRTVNVAGGTLTTGPVSGYGYGLVKAGAGTLTLGAVALSRITGDLVVSGGRLQIGINDFITAGTLSGSGTLENGSATGRWFFTNNGKRDSSFSGTIQNGSTGFFGLHKTGAGTLTLTGPTSYTDRTVVGGGMIEYGSTSLPGITRTLSGNANPSLTFVFGDGAIKSSSDGTGTAILTFATNAIGRTAGATGNFIVAGGTNGTSNSIRITQAAGFINQGLFFNGDNYAWMDGTNTFVRALNYNGTEGVTTGTTTSVASTAHLEFTGAITNQAAATFTTLKDSGNNNLTLASGATVTTNGILKTGNVAGGATISGGTGIQAASGAELVIRTDGLNDSLTISTPILANGASSLTKSGAGTLTLSSANTYTGVTTVAGGTLNLTGSIAGGSAITVSGGVMNISGSTGTGTGQISVQGGANGILNILPGAVVNRANLIVGQAHDGAAGMGAVYQSGGSVTLTQAAGTGNFQLGNGINGYGYYKMTGGTLTLNEMGIGGATSAGTTGVMEVTNGGSIANSGWLIVGRGSGSTSGTLTVDGGSITALRTQLNSATVAGAQSIINIKNGSITNTGNATIGVEFTAANTAGTSSIINLLSGGTLSTGIVLATQANPTALLNFNGGTLKATATNAGATFLTAANLDAVTVYSGGGTVDNSGTSITVSRPILAPAGSGVSDITFTGGTGYIGAPQVIISGGGGTGATANATIDGNGNLTGFVITNPGTGYTSTPNVALLFGAGGGATITGVTLAANTSGGMTFTGSGTTTLSGQSTYTGNVAINQGTVIGAVTNVGNPTFSAFGNATIAGRTITVASGATLRLNNNDSFGNQAAVAANLPSIIVNGGTFINANFNQVGTVTLNGATMTSSNGGAAGTYHNTQFLNDVIVGGTAASLINGTVANPGNHLNTVTTFNVADATGSANTDLTVSVPLLNRSGNYGSSAGGLAKTGVGTMALTAASTYTGSTAVNGGTLLIGGTGSINSTTGIDVNGSGARFVQTSSTAVSPVVALTNGTVDGTTTINTVNVADLATNTIANGNGTAGAPLTIGALTFAGAGRFNLLLNSTSAGVATTTLTADGGAGSVLIDATNAVWNNGSTYDLISYGGGTIGGTGISAFATGTITGLGARQSATLGNSGTAITLAIAGDLPVWTGLQNGNWTTAVVGGASNWRLQTGLTNTDFLTNDTVLFADTIPGGGAPGTTNVDIIQAGGVAPTSTTFTNSTLPYTITASGGSGITTGTLTKSGTAALTLGGAHSYTGATALNDGTTNLTGTLGNTAVTVAAPATLSLQAANAISQNTLTVHGTLTQTANNALSGTAAVVLNNGATLGNANSHSGGTTLNAGTLNINNNTALGTGTFTLASGTIDNTSGGLVTLTNNNAQRWTGTAVTFTGTNALNMGTGAVTLGADASTQTIAVTNNSALGGNSLTIGGPVTSAAGGVAGVKTLNISGSGNTAFTGNVTIGAATGLIINHTSAGTLTLSGAASSITTLNMNGGASSIVELGAGNLTVANGGGSIIQSTTGGTINATGGGAIVLGNANGDFGTMGGTTLTVNAKITGANALDFWNNNGGAGLGTVVLNGPNDYSGVTNVQNTKVVVKSAINQPNNANQGQINVGNVANQRGVLEVDGGTINATKTSAPSIHIAPTDNAIGAINLLTGTINAPAEMWFGQSTTAGTSYGALNMSAGTINSGGWFVIGRNGLGSANMSGGILNVTGANFTGGSFASALGVTTLSGNAIVNVTNTGANQGRFIVAEGGVAHLNVTGNAALNIAGVGGLNFASGGTPTAAGTGTGIANLNGGTVTTTAVSKGTGTGTGTLNFDGGTLKASAANATFMQGLTNAYINDGGAIIDDGGFAITVAQPLRAPTGDGVSAINVTGGTGYVGAPVVNITGDGFGATAIANIDSNGNLTGITITNPGVGYTTANATLAGGGGTGASVDSVNLAANASGGLTKNGAGTLTMTSAANTFTGAVTVNAGTLYALPPNAAAGAFNTVSDIVVNNGATLRSGANGLFGFGGTLEKPITVNAGGTLVADGGAGSGDVFVGVVTLAGGTLATLAGSTDYGTWSFINAGDKLIATENSTVSALNMRFQAGAPIEVAAGRTLDLTGTITNTTLGGNSGLTKEGAGTLVLAGANSYSDPTTVNAGTLIVSGSISGTTSVAVNSSSTLGGGGSITTGGNGNVTVAAGGKLSPGASAGTLSLTLGTGTLDISTGVAANNTQSLVFELDTPAASDKVAFTSGFLTIGTGVLAFNDFVFSNLGGLTNDTYTLFDGVSPIVGTLDANAANLMGSLGGGFTGTLGIADGGNDLVLVVIPEPSAVVSLLGGLGTLLGLRRFRRRSI